MSLPAGRHSHSLAKLAALEAARDLFEAEGLGGGGVVAAAFGDVQVGRRL